MPRSYLSRSGTWPTIDSDWNLQARCPLFNKVPAEIRDRIFLFALSPFDDLHHPWKPGQHWYRPGHHYPQKLDTRLLQTCKRIYHECRLMPIKLNEFVFHLLDGPYDPVYPAEPAKVGVAGRLSCLTKDQQGCVESLHYFVQQTWLEDWPSAIAWRARHFPKKLTLTLRRTDWWPWELDEESSDILGICPWLPGRVTRQMMEAEPLDPALDYIQSRMLQAGVQQHTIWGRMFAQPERLESLEIQLETEIKKKDQLDAVVDRAKRWKFPRPGGAHFSWTGEISETKWEGLASPIGEGGKDALSSVTNVVAALRFRRAKPSNP